MATRLAANMRRVSAAACLGLCAAAAMVFGATAAFGAAEGEISNDDCFACHDDPELEALDAAGNAVSAFVDPARYKASAHGENRCTSCHADITDIDHDEDLAPVRCERCHRLETEIYRRSDHGRALAAGRKGAASCKDCHSNHHSIVSARQPDSPVYRLNQVETCGACHTRNPKIRVSMAEPVLTYAATVHGRALLEKGNEAAATCTDCHGSHDLWRASNPNSRVFRGRIPDTCGRCHQNVEEVYRRSVHGTAVLRGIHDAPVCTDCHGEHTILSPEDPASTVFATTISRVTCPQCHDAERITTKFGIRGQRAETYMSTYHGLASQMGVTTVANCASCHGHHDILPSSDSRSSVNPANLGVTCSKCHPGASTALLARLRVHGGGDGRIRPRTIVVTIYQVLIPLIIGGMLLHHGLDLVRKLRAHHRQQRTAARQPLRWSRVERAEHVCLLVSFVALAYSGFVIRFPTAWWGGPIRAIGGEAFRSGFHRVFAVIFIALTLVHILRVVATHRGRRFLKGMWTRRSDLREFWRFLRGRTRTVVEPHEPNRFSYITKAEYWALVWGSVVMIATGLILVYTNWVLTHLPGWVPEVATAIHFYEAVLATLAVLVWHLYRVIFDPKVYPMDFAWITGRAPEIAPAEESEGAPLADSPPPDCG